MARRTPKPFTVEIRGSKRKPRTPGVIEQPQPQVEWPAAMRDALREHAIPDAEPMPIIVAPPPRRILPALEKPTPVISAEIVKIDPGDRPEPTASPVNHHEVLEASLPPQSQPVPGVDDPMPVRITRPVRRLRRARSEFARGERWKARLPASVHRANPKP